MVNNRQFYSSDGNSIAGSGLLDLPAGDYELEVTGELQSKFRVLDPASATPYTLGATQPGQLIPGNRSDLYRFEATQGQRYNFSFSALDSYYPYVRIVDPSGRAVYGPTSTNTNSNAGQFTATQTGTYVLMLEGAYHWGNESPEYEFAVEPILPNPTLELSTTTSGDASYAEYKFTLDEDKRLYFDGLSNQSGTTWMLVGPRGTVASARTFDYTSPNYNGGAFDVPPGEYTLTIVNPSSLQYSFRMLDLSDGLTITPGLTVSGQLNPANETDVYHFTAATGARFYFDSLLSEDEDTRWRLLDPNGKLVFGPLDMADDKDVITLVASGTYTLLIEGHYQSTVASNYRFNAIPVPSSAVQIIDIGSTPGPDLQVRNLTVTPSGGTIVSGSQITVTWDVLNAGNEATSGTWQDRLIVTGANGETIGNFIVNYDDIGNVPLAPGASRTRTVTLQLPDGNAGAGEPFVPGDD